MGVLPGAPKSFKVDRKSHLAAKLKSLIIDRLLHSCPDYADDVLAEYITVLVCNGKNQNQAKEDLEAFLGAKSEEFVSWLWQVLLKYEHSLTVGISPNGKGKSSSNSHDTYIMNDDRNEKFMGLQSQGNSESDNLMDKSGEETCRLSVEASKSYDMPTAQDHYSGPPTMTMSRNIKSSCPQSKYTNVSSSAKVDLPSVVRQAEIVHHPKEVERPSSLTKRHPDSLPQRNLLSSTHSSRHTKLSEHPQIRSEASVLETSISPLPSVASSHDKKPRRSVWDRLGKPQKCLPSRGQIADFDVMNKTHLSKDLDSKHPPVVHKHGDQVARPSPLHHTHTDGQGNRVREVYRIVKDAGPTRLNGTRRSDDVDPQSQAPSVNNIRRKRHFGDLTGQTDDDLAVKVVPQAHKKPEVSLEASQVIDSVRDVKLRLRQVEIEMAKLRSKQTEMEKDGKTNLLINNEIHSDAFAAILKATEEDADSRTIYLTNVHHKATKEALSMYFGTCGAIVNVILTDSIPFAAPRSAYITFASKESADKALGLSRTTFYSRTVLVSRKREKASPSSAKFSGVRNQVQAFQGNSIVTPEKLSFPGAHLQWQREPLTPIHSETAASTTKQTAGAPGFASDQQGDVKQCPSTSAVKFVEEERESADPHQPEAAAHPFF